ncbi:MAG TPA: hypothetical protein VI056_15260 [Candidatus Limnocylindria bacterium]
MRSRGPLVARILAVLLLVAATFLFVRWWDFTLPSFGARYQAVFLANGQTYFGHYLDRLGPYVKVENAFYITQEPTVEEGQTPESRIIRRGSELHQPLPFVLIPKSAILFVEDLRADSQVGLFMDRELGK